MKSESIRKILKLAAEIKKISTEIPKENQQEFERIHQELLEEIKKF